MYYLEGNEVMDWVFRNELTLAINFKHTAFFYKMNIWSPEFEVSVPDDLKAKYKTGLYQRNASDWNHTGVIGLLWRL